MATYKNDYSKEEDSLLWELHNIRHDMAEKNQGKTIEEINSDARKILDQWQKKRNEKLTV